MTTENKKFSAQSLDDAITMATVEFGIPSDQLGYEVIQEGSRGFLGIGARPFIINAWAKKADTFDDDIEKETKKALRSFDKSEKKADVKSEKKENRKPEKKQDKPAEKKQENRSEEKKADVKPEKKQDKFVEKKQKSFEKKEDRQPVKSEEKPVVEKIKTTENDQAHFEEGVQFLKDVFEKMDLPVNINYVYNEEDNALEIDLSGDEMGVLIGKRGQTLDSLQYLTGLVVNRTGEHYIRVKLDTENYRERRKETLEALAKNIAYKVKRTKRSVSLEPMNPYERRIIHSALQPDNFVMTKSEGEDPYRHVVVFYKRNRNGEAKQ